MRESHRDRRLRSVAARVGQDSGRSAPCVQPKTPDGHHRENVRSARDVLPRSVRFSVAIDTESRRPQWCGPSHSGWSARYGVRGYTSCRLIRWYDGAFEAEHGSSSPPVWRTWLERGRDGGNGKLGLSGGFPGWLIDVAGGLSQGRRWGSESRKRTPTAKEDAAAKRLTMVILAPLRVPRMSWRQTRGALSEGPWRFSNKISTARR